MSEKTIQIAENADMIVDGYAFTGYESGCRVIEWKQCMFMQAILN